MVLASGHLLTKLSCQPIKNIEKNQDECTSNFYNKMIANKKHATG